MIALEVPSEALLPGYAAALETGWSPNNLHDVSAEHLAAIRADPRGFLADLNRRGGGTIPLPDGTEVPRLPCCVRWIVEGSGDRTFCGTINLRFREGTEALPPYVSGHIGYAIVPWKRGRGYATAALGRMLPIARAEGLASVEVVCDEDNEASRKVILSNGGVFSGTRLECPDPGRRKLIFRVPTG